MLSEMSEKREKRCGVKSDDLQMTVLTWKSSLPREYSGKNQR